MKRIELHAKTKYSSDYDSLIDIEALLWNARENGERGIVIVDKDSIYSFPKTEDSYKKLCKDDVGFKEFKVVYGVQLTVIIDGLENEVVILIKHQKGLKKVYEIMSLYFENDKKINYEDLVNFRDDLVIGIMLTNDNRNINLDLFDYVEISGDIDVSDIRDKKLIVYSNIPNSFLPGEKIVKEVLYGYYGISREPVCRLYRNTEEVLNEYNDERIVVTNSNLIFDNLDRIVINDAVIEFLDRDRFNIFSNKVRKAFENKYKNASDKNKIRLEQELQLIKDFNLLSYFTNLEILTQFCKDNNAYYQLGGFINNSLIAFVLDLTNIEPYHLPYELFFSENPKIVLSVSITFYKDKMVDFIREVYGEKLIKCNERHKLSSENIFEMINCYESRENIELTLGTKDYIAMMLQDFTLERRDNIRQSFYIIPEGKEITDFTPYLENRKGGVMKETYFDYLDLNERLIPICFDLSYDLDDINNLIHKTDCKIEQYTDRKVYNLFRNTEPFNLKFKILDMKTGVLNVAFNYEPKIENRLVKMANISMEELVKVIVKISNVLIKDDLYSNLKNKGLGDLEIFTMLNYLEEDGKIKLVARADLINQVRTSYQYMYYKLYYPKEYYGEMLNHGDSKDIFKRLKNYDNEKIIERYEKLKGTNNYMEFEELWTLEILIEMIERNIDFQLEEDGVVVG